MKHAIITTLCLVLLSGAALAQDGLTAPEANKTSLKDLKDRLIALEAAHYKKLDQNSEQLQNAKLQVVQLEQRRAKIVSAYRDELSNIKLALRSKVKEAGLWQFVTAHQNKARQLADSMNNLRTQLFSARMNNQLSKVGAVKADIQSGIDQFTKWYRNAVNQLEAAPASQFTK